MQHSGRAGSPKMGLRWRPLSQPPRRSFHPTVEWRVLLSKELSGHEEAEMLYRRVLEVDPDDVNTPHELGLVTGPTFEL